MLSTPPNDGAMYGIFKESMNLMVVCKSPSTYNKDQTLTSESSNYCQVKDNQRVELTSKLTTPP